MDDTFIDPAGSGEFAVGLGDASSSAIIKAYRDLVDNSVLEATAALDSVRQLSIDRIESCIDECNTGISECRSCLHGQIEISTAVAESIVAGLSARVSNKINQHAEMAGAHLVSLFQQLPAPWLSLPSDQQPVLSPAYNDPAGAVDLSAVYAQIQNAGANYRDGGATLQPGYGPIIHDPLQGDETVPVGGGPNTGGGGGGGGGGGDGIERMCVNAKTGSFTSHDQNGLLVSCSIDGNPNNVGECDTLGAYLYTDNDKLSKCDADTQNTFDRIDPRSGVTVRQCESKVGDSCVLSSSPTPNPVQPPTDHKCQECSPDEFDGPPPISCGSPATFSLTGGVSSPTPQIACTLPVTADSFCSLDGSDGFEDQGPQNVDDVREWMFSNAVQGVSAGFERAYPNGVAGSIIGRAVYWAYGQCNSATLYIASSLVQAHSQILPSPRGCNNVGYEIAKAKASILNLLNKFWGLVTKQQQRIIDYELNYFCQADVATFSEATSLNAIGAITDKEWTFARKINGMCLAWGDKLKYASQYFHSVADSVALWKSGKIEEGQLNINLIRNRITDPVTQDEIKYLADKTPGLRDLFDRFDRELDKQYNVDQYGYDDLWDTFWEGDNEEWSKKQGYTADQVKALFKQHYRDVSPELAIEIYKRGDFEEDDILHWHIAAGYTRKIAETLTKSAIDEFGEQRAVRGGKLTATEITLAYTVGNIPIDEFKAKLKDAGVPDNEINDRVNSAEFRRALTLYQSELRTVRGAYERGRLSMDEYDIELSRIGMDKEKRKEEVAHAEFERQWSEKQLRISKLCEFVSRGYMTIQEYMKHAKNLGYSGTDAALMASACVAEINEKREKERQSAIRAEIAAEEKAERKRKADYRQHRREYLALHRCRTRTPALCAADLPVPPDI